jgi:hypothetical protein
MIWGYLYFLMFGKPYVLVWDSTGIWVPVKIDDLGVPFLETSI